jgi:hypothetical protein
MGVGWYGDTDRIDTPGELPCARKRRRPELMRNLLGAWAIGIYDPDQIHTIHGGVDARVVLPEMTDADHGDLHGLRHPTSGADAEAPSSMRIGSLRVSASLRLV